MKLKQLSSLSCIVGLGLLSGSCNKKNSPDQIVAPNLVIVYPDQMRGQAMGFLNQEPVRTPRLDKFAKESLVLTQAVANFPICSPSRAMLFSGKYPHTNGVLNNCNTESARFGYELKTEERCWSDVLNENGYELGYIGKWHLDNPYEPYIDCNNNRGNKKWNEWCPPERRHGFNYWYSYGTYDLHLRPMYWDTNSGRDDFFYVDQWGPEHEADKAIDYIENKNNQFRDATKPFALVVAMNPPHSPYSEVPEKYKYVYSDIPIEDLTKRPNIPAEGTIYGDLYRKHIRDYYAMVTGVDEQFGRILDALNREGLTENTIVLFTSDHGNCLGIHQVESKGYHYEESMCIPFLIRWPGKIMSRQDNLLLSTPDIYPTILDLMGLKSQIPSEVEGISHASIFRNNKGERPDTQFFIYTYYGEPDMGRRGVRTSRYTLMIEKKDNKVTTTELYDNLNDPYQMDNLTSKHPELLSKMKEILKDELKKRSDPWILD